MKKKIGIVLIVSGSMWLGAGLLSMYVFITLTVKYGPNWSLDILTSFLMAGIPVGAVLLFLGIKRLRRLLK